MIIFGKTQDAWSTPFEPNRIVGGVSTDLESLTVQEAIEEAKADALNNDRFLLLCSYNGNANAGRYMEFFSGIDSSLAPIYLSAPAKCIVLVISATANSNGVIGIYNLAVSSTTPVYTLSYGNTSRAIAVGSAVAPLFNLPSNSQIALRVVSGSVNRPHIYFSLSAST